MNHWSCNVRILAQKRQVTETSHIPIGWLVKETENDTQGSDFYCEKTGIDLGDYQRHHEHCLRGTDCTNRKHLGERLRIEFVIQQCCPGGGSK
ncbi:hypothetical protein D3C81_1804100 [compost metagenome]